jgi:hypothetical protein
LEGCKLEVDGGYGGVVYWGRSWELPGGVLRMSCNLLWAESDCSLISLLKLELNISCTGRLLLLIDQWYRQGG